MTAEIYELIFRGLKAKYPGQAIGPHFQFFKGHLCAH